MGAFIKGSNQAEFSLIEGNHGLYDSLELDGKGSSAAVARTLQAPIILVLNAARISRSAAALVHGYQTFEPDTQIAAVILNNVAQGRHESKLRQAIEHYCQIPVVGALPRDERLSIPDRHLGLTPHGEADHLPAAIGYCQKAVEQYVDLAALLEIAQQAPPIAVETGFSASLQPNPEASPRVCLGVVRDRAFSFYYPENLEALQEAGAELVFINALENPRLPAVDGLLIGGGFPELFLSELETNSTLRGEIREAVEDSLPVYAECGGLMYLSESIRPMVDPTSKKGVGESRAMEMVGVFPFEVEMINCPQGHGYVLAESTGENPFFESGVILRGHEFHHSRLIGSIAGRNEDHPKTSKARLQNWPTALHLKRGNGLGDQRDGLVYKNTLACYTHLHAGGTPDWAAALVAKAASFAGLGGTLTNEAKR